MIDADKPHFQGAVWSVAALVNAINDTLASKFSVVVMRGEVASFTRAGSGHCYLSLKDADGAGATLRCAMFRRAASLLDFSPADGQLVEVRGRVAVYEPRGELQFVIESMQRAGAGALFEQFLKLRAKLQSEGLFDESAKRGLPLYPKRIGVITSLGAAALHDVLTTLARRVPHIGVVIYPSLVQGVDAPAALVAALAVANERREVDALILCRGGGSLEDLWAFNDEGVVRAIARSTLPLVCGVGHETDLTLSDMAADVRAPTPTAAAELVAPSQLECLQVLANLGTLMSRAIRRRLDAQTQRLDHAATRLRSPADALRQRAQKLLLLEHQLRVQPTQRIGQQTQAHVALAARLRQSAKTLQSQHAHQLAALAARLEALNPERVLSRGYAWLTDARGQPVISVNGLGKGQVVRVVLADGNADAKLTKVSPREFPTI
jgi:exodeoxyribonuclease VII large subunit